MKILLLSTFLAVFIFAADNSVFAQKSTLISKGTTTNSQGVKLSDWEMKLVKNKTLKTTQSIKVLEAHTYYFKAKKGQYFFGKMNSKQPPVNFTLYDERGTRIGDSTTETWSWQGELETDGEYKLIVSSSNEEGGSTYTLTVKIN